MSMSRANTTLEIHHVSKSYGPIKALQDVNLGFDETGIYGLFGRNGAGKTTLLDIISSRIFADRGHVTCFDKDISRFPGIVAKNCCYMPEKHYFPERYTVRRLLGVARMAFPDFSVMIAEKLCKRFQLNKHQKYGELSMGYKSIFKIVLGMASNSPITIFDEPVLGLDAAARDLFYSELIESFTDNPRMFIISTHLIEESADLFNEAVILKEGRVLRQAPVEELLASAFYVSGKSNEVDAYIKQQNVIGCQSAGDMKTAVIAGNLQDMKPERGLRFSTLTIQKLFIHLTQKGTEGQQR